MFKLSVRGYMPAYGIRETISFTSLTSSHDPILCTSIMCVREISTWPGSALGDLVHPRHRLALLSLHMLGASLLDRLTC